MITQVNKEATISAGKIMLGIKTFEKYNKDFANEDLQLELVTIYVTEPADLMKLKNNDFMEEQKSKVFSELSSEVFEEVLNFFPLVVAKQYLKSLGLKQEQIDNRVAEAEKEVLKIQNSILQRLEESSQTTQETLN